MRIYKLWTEVELMDLWDMECDKLHINDMVSLLGRTRPAIEFQLGHLIRDSGLYGEARNSLLIKQKCKERNKIV